jgi:cytochrome c556
MKRTKKKTTGKRLTFVLAAALGLAATFGATDAQAVKNPILQSMMKQLNTFATAGDGRRTAMILKLVRGMGPDEYKDWNAIAEKGRLAAARGDMVAAKAACTSCHDQYREPYRAKYGSGGSGPGPVPRD